MALWDSVYQLLPESWRKTMSTSVQILITGKTGTGKSALINGIIGEDIATEGHSLNRGTTDVKGYELKYQDVDITIWDSPGLQDGLDNEVAYLKDMRKKCANVDLVLYCTRMDDTRMRDDDIKAIVKLTKGLGKELWINAVFVLTFANYVKPPRRRGSKQITEEQYFVDRMKQWKEKLSAAVQEAGVNPEVVKRIPIIPAGYDSEIGLPDRKYWLSPLWYASIIRMKENSQPALLKANIHRIKLPDQVSPEDFQKPLSQQPLILPPSIKYGAPPPIFTLIGAALGGVVAGPLGAFAGGAAGAGVGAAVDGVIAYFSKGETAAESDDSVPQ